MKPAQAWLGAGRAVWAGPRDGRSKGSADAPGKVRRRPDVWLNALPMVVGGLVASRNVSWESYAGFSFR